MLNIEIEQKCVFLVFLTVSHIFHVQKIVNAINDEIQIFNTETKEKLGLAISFQQMTTF